MARAACACSRGCESSASTWVVSSRSACSSGPAVRATCTRWTPCVSGAASIGSASAIGTRRELRASTGRHMQISGAQLTYCTNIHPGESWEQVFENVRTHVLAVKALVAPERAFGVGLRLSAQAARSLREPDRLLAFREFLDRHQLYVFTINGFPYGPFHAQPVKGAVYRPDWREPERGRYTSDLACLLAELLPEGSSGSISTVPGGFKADLAGPEHVSRIAAQLVEQALELHRRQQRSGRLVPLALEPEPCCLLETPKRRWPSSRNSCSRAV